MKIVFLFFIVCVVLTVGSADAVSVSVDAIHAEINLNEYWFTITQDTEEIDLSGSNLSFLQRLLLHTRLGELKTWLQQEDNAEIYAMCYYYDGNNTVGAYFLVEENEVSLELWDCSLYEEEYKAAMEMETEIFADKYITSSNDLYFAKHLEDGEDENLNYLYYTMNNGKYIYVVMEAEEVENQETFLKICHELLEGVSYTRAPKPTISTEGSASLLAIFQEQLAQYDGAGQQEVMQALGLGIGLLLVLFAGFGYREWADARKTKKGHYVIGEVSLKQAGYAMKWHKLLVNFVLWAHAVWAIQQAFLLFTGHVYGMGNEIKKLYLVLPMLKLADYAYGGWFLVFAILLLVTRFRLADLRVKGPTMLTWCYALNSVMEHGYERAGLASFRSNEAIYRLITENDTSSLSTSGFSTYIPAILFIIFNYLYYKNRRDLFSE